jgi:hypothetical protein
MAAPKGNKFIDCPKLKYQDNLISCDFINEKEMVKFIDYYAKLFARDVLEIDYKDHKKEYYLGSQIKLIKGNKPHVDFIFESQSGELVLCECKNTKNTYAELSNSIGQLLSYFCIAKNQGVKIKRLCIISNKFDERLRSVINEFKLPIEVYIFSKTKILKLMN